MGSASNIRVTWWVETATLSEAFRVTRASCLDHNKAGLSVAGVWGDRDVVPGQRTKETSG